MKKIKIIAIPEYEGRVSPLLDRAEKLLIFQVSQQKVLGEPIILTLKNNLKLLDQLILEGVDVLICNGVSRNLAFLIEDRGISILPCVIGIPLDIVNVFLSDNLYVKKFIMPGCFFGKKNRECTGYKEFLKKNKRRYKMKIVLTAQGEDLSSKLDPRFGRAKGFIVYDLEDDSFEYVSNIQNYSAPQGAGIQSAKNIVDTDASILISGHVGPKAFEVLKMAEIGIIYQEEEEIQKIIDAYKAGKLKVSDDANAESHW